MPPTTLPPVHWLNCRMIENNKTIKTNQVLIVICYVVLTVFDLDTALQLGIFIMKWLIWLAYLSALLMLLIETNTSNLSKKLKPKPHKGNM